MSCKELIDIFEKIGGKFVVNYDKRECTLLPQNVTKKVSKDDRDHLGTFLSEFGCSSQFDDFVTFLPESEKRKKSIFVDDLVHNYQYKNTGGFVVELKVDKDGYYVPNKVKK